MGTNLDCWLAPRPRLSAVELQQGLPDGLTHHAPHLEFAVKLHLTLGRMNVNVHIRRVEFNEQAADRVAAFHQGGVVAFEQGEIEASVLDGAAIDKEVLVFARGA